MADSESVRLLQRFKDGDQTAAEELYTRYVHRLVGLARSRISERLKRRVEAEDLVQSAYRSFFRKAEEGCFDPQRSGELWKLLAAITMNKLRQKIEFHGAAKRNFEREASPLDLPVGVQLEELADDPSPDEAIALVEEVEHVMRQLDERARRVLELRLQDHNVSDIAGETGYSERSVRRKLEEIGLLLRQRLQG